MKGAVEDWKCAEFLAGAADPRGVSAEGRIDTISGLSGTALGVPFVELADPYQSVARSLKYALLFLGLVFSAYFVFEVTTGTVPPQGH